MYIEYEVLCCISSTKYFVVYRVQSTFSSIKYEIFCCVSNKKYFLRASMAKYFLRIKCEVLFHTENAGCYILYLKHKVLFCIPSTKYFFDAKYKVLFVHQIRGILTHRVWSTSCKPISKYFFVHQVRNTCSYFRVRITFLYTKYEVLFRTSRAKYSFVYQVLLVVFVFLNIVQHYRPAAYYSVLSVLFSGLRYNSTTQGTLYLKYFTIN